MKRILGLFILCTLTVSVSAQLDLEALKRQSDARAQERKNESSAFLQDRNTKWNSFLDTRSNEWDKTIANHDVGWTDFLSGSEWKVFEDFLIDRQPEKPKPTVVPKVETEPAGRPQPQPVIIPDRSVVKPEPKPQATPRTVPQVQPERLPCKPAEPMPDRSKTEAKFKFYGREMAIQYDAELKTFSAAQYTPKEISDFWKVLSAVNYTPTVDRLIQEKESIGLSDWGYYLLINEFSRQIYQDKNRVTLLTWFLLVRSGLDARVGYNDGGVILMLPTATALFDMSYVMLDGAKYYVINNGTGQGIKTCPGSYSNGRQLDFNQTRPLQLGGRSTVRTLAFEFNGQKYSMDFNYDADLTEYYKSLPQAQFEVFFNAAPSNQLKQSIEKNLRPVIQGMDKPTALNFLLQFVQLSFDYKTDPEQFGKEKYFYADELFLYPYCDCEDRSVLFSYLAHELMGYNVVGTEFPEHMATAVELDYQVSGTKYRIGEHTYTVADPTYMRASVGQCMSRYEKSTPIIHKIEYKK